MEIITGVNSLAYSMCIYILTIGLKIIRLLNNFTHKAQPREIQLVMPAGTPFFLRIKGYGILWEKTSAVFSVRENVERGCKAFALFFLKTDGSLCANFRRLRQRVPTKSSADNTIFFL